MPGTSDGMSDDVSTHAAGDDDGEIPAGELDGSSQPDEVGAVAQAGAGDCDARAVQRVEVGAAAVEREDARIKPPRRQRGYQRRPLPLSAASLEVGADEDDPRTEPCGHATLPASIWR